MITKGNKTEQRIFYLNQIMNLYENIKKENENLNEYQISELLGFSVSTIRRYKKERELLINIRNKEEEKE